MDNNTAKDFLKFVIHELGSTGVAAKKPAAPAPAKPMSPNVQKGSRPLAGRAEQQKAAGAAAAKIKADKELASLQPNPNAKLSKRDQAIADDVARATQARMLKKIDAEKAQKDETWRKEQVAKRTQAETNIKQNSAGKGLPTSNKNAAPKVTTKSPQIFGGKGPLRNPENPPIGSGKGMFRNPGQAPKSQSWLDKAMNFGGDAYKSFKNKAKEVANSKGASDLMQRFRNARDKMAAKGASASKAITKASPAPMKQLPPVQPQRVIAPVQPRPVMAAPQAVQPAPMPRVMPQPVVQPAPMPAPAQAPLNRVQQAQRYYGVGTNRQQGSRLGPRR